MPRPPRARGAPAGDVRTVAQAYLRYAQTDAARTSPLHEHVALALARHDEALRALGAAPARSRRPAAVLAALHDLALAGRAPELSRAYAAGDGEASAAAAIVTLLRMPDAVAAIATRHRLRTDETGRGAVLYPAIAEAARQAGAGAVGLIDVGCSAGLNLTVDRVGISYGDGVFLGDRSSAVQLAPTVVGGRPVPHRCVPEVVARIGVDPDPLDLTDADDARWLRACLPPDQPARSAALDAEISLAAAAPVVLLRGDPVDLVPDAVAQVAGGALPVVITTWALSRWPVHRRRRLLQRLEEAAVERPVAWVSVEGVAVAPTIPTLGDRPASGHSIIGLLQLGGGAARPAALGRCWSRGRLLSWFAD